MTAAFNNAFAYLVSVLFHVAMGLFLTRILLQAVRADFYNPISQAVWRATQTVASPLQRLLPRLQGRLDVACTLVLVALTVLYIEAMSYLYSFSPDFASVAWFTLLKIAMLLLEMYTLFMFVQAILSWVGPGVSNPAANILWSLNEPILRPIRRVIPPLAGRDFSPLIAMVAMQFIVRMLPLPGIY